MLKPLWMDCLPEQQTTEWRTRMENRRDLTELDSQLNEMLSRILAIHEQL
jgi:hypothetical protein